jgi:Flp pilus assembly pilin Flp
MRQLWKRIWDEEGGQNLSEYALILVLVGLLAASVVSALGMTVRASYSTVYAAFAHGSSAASNISSSSNPASNSSDESGSNSASNSSSRSGSGGSGNGNRDGRGLARGHH